LQDDVYQIVGCAREVLNTLGLGLLEKPDENERIVEFGLRNIPVINYLKLSRLPVGGILNFKQAKLE